MKYLTFVRHAESLREAGPPPALMSAMGEFVQRSRSSGVLVDTGGLYPSPEGARIELTGGNLTVRDGPFTESREVIGGWAILQTQTRAEAMRIAQEFMELHRTHWPQFEGECEIRRMYEPSEAPGCA